MATADVAADASGGAPTDHPPHHLDHALFLLPLGLAIVGLVMVFSARYPLDTRPNDDGIAGDAFATVRRQAVAVGIGLVVLLLASRYVRSALLRQSARGAYWLTVILLLLVFTPLGVESNGARRWLDLPGLPAFQPSALAHTALALYLAFILGGPLAGRLDRRRRQNGSGGQPPDRSRQRGPRGAQTPDPGATSGEETPFAESVMRALGAAGLMAVLVVAEHDLGTTVMLFGLALGMLFVAGLHPLLVGLLTSAGAAAALVYARYFSDYAWDRIVGFLDPLGHAKDEGFHILKMLAALARGGVLGAGLGQSPDKWFRFPARHTDSIYCIVGGELGLVGCLALLLAFGWLGCRIAHVAMHQRDRFSALLATGLGLVICLPVVVNIAVATKLLPCTGLTLPFVSYGGTSVVVSLAAVGLLLALSRYTTPDRGG